MKNPFHLLRSRSPRLLFSASLLGVLLLSPPARLSFGLLGTPAYAQTAVSTQEVQNYARSILEIEPIRQEAYDAIKRLTGSGDVPPIICNRPDSLSHLNRDVRQIAVDYCRQSVQVAARHGLPADRFNTITAALQSDPDLATRIQEAMVQIQRGSN